ncbi:hypothetical protein Tco_0997096, partial [Tanacetum coccineum]
KDEAPEEINIFLEENYNSSTSSSHHLLASLPKRLLSKRLNNMESWNEENARWAICYPKTDRGDIGKPGAKGDIGFFIGYSANSRAYRVYNQRTKKIMETMNVTFDELLAMAFEQSTMYDDYIAGQSLATPRTTSAAQVPKVLQTLTTSTTTADTAPTLTNSSSQAANTLNTSQDVDELKPQQ